MQKVYFLLFNIVFIGIIYNLFLLSRNVSIENNSNSNRNNSNSNKTNEYVENILTVKKYLLKAHRYSRSIGLKETLNKAIYLINKNIITESSVMSNIINLKNSQLQFFISETTAIIFSESCFEAKQLYQKFRMKYETVFIIFGLLNKICSINSQDKNLKIVQTTEEAKDLFILLEKVKTKYVFVATNVINFNPKDLNLERMIEWMELFSYNIDFVSGMTDMKYSNCYQMDMRLYTIKIVQGHDFSLNSCYLCDYSTSPFVTKTNLLKSHLITSNLFRARSNLNSVFLHLFTYLQMITNNKPSISVCPFSIFKVKTLNSLFESPRSDWIPYLKEFQLNRVIIPQYNLDLQFKCDEVNMNCIKQKGVALPFCCMKELSDSLKFMNRLLIKENVTFEVLEGTVMGGIKYNNILFWERDADTNFRTQQIDKLEAKLDELYKQGYQMQLSYECPFKRDWEKCRRAGYHGASYYAFKTKNWRTEMYGVLYILSDFRGKVRFPTKLLIDGEWYITYTNPALYGRNIYGDDIFKHVEHYSTIGKGSKSNYTHIRQGNFPKCPRPGFHYCLDQFSIQSGLQFQDIYL